MEYRLERLAFSGCFHADARAGGCCLPHFTVHSVYCILILCTVGHVMAQVVSWLPFTWWQLRFYDRPVHVGFVADIVVLGQFLSQTNTVFFLTQTNMVFFLSQINMVFFLCQINMVFFLSQINMVFFISV